MKAIINYSKIGALFLCALLISCEDYLEIETPDHKMVNQTVFESDETAESAMTGIYNQLSSALFSSGGVGSVTVLSGLSGDNLMPIYETNIPYMDFERHEIALDNIKNAGLWSSAYNMIYMTNSLLEGLSQSGSVSKEVEERLTGEAKFVRAFVYFYLVNLYGDVPLITTTDYQANSLAPRDSKEDIYEKILIDLQDASEVLNEEFSSGERTEVNRFAALALLARVHLYLENWSKAEKYSSLVIAHSEYQILQDLNDVFLANSEEAIWQLSPYGRGLSLTNTPEGSAFIIDPFFYFLAELKLSNTFVESFDPEDQRLSSWIGYSDGLGVYFPYKYKIQNSTGEALEYSMVLRLSEQYLIRAEARAKMGDLNGAIADLDVVRERAGLSSVMEVQTTIDQAELISLIMEERNKELFTEWGHRWLDLKRTDLVHPISDSTNGWENTDVFYPIPESELIKNPNLTQNDGY